ncbi:MAG TPA: lysophospholipid acyltransferase family protein [Gemmatimonadales bacterium]
MTTISSLVPTDQRIHRPRGLVEHARVALRLGGVLAWTGVSYGLFLVPALVTRGSPPARRRVNAWAQRLWTRGLLRVLGVRRTRRGAPPVPPYFLVSNHLSYLDILVLGAELGAVFVSKHDLAGWPLLGHLSRVTGTIFIDRGRRRDAVRVLAEIDGAIAAGAGVLLFPEGTSSRGDGILPLRAALLEWAARSGHPVHVATVRYATEEGDRPASETVCWWGDATPILPHFLGLAALPRIHAEIVYGEAPVSGTSRTDLATALHTELTRLFAPVGAATHRTAPSPRDIPQSEEDR